MRGALSHGGKGPLRISDELMDLDRLVSQLPDDLRRVLLVEYAQSGTVDQRVAAYGMSQPTYYRRLEAAKLALFDLQLKAAGYGDGVSTPMEEWEVLEE